MLPAQESNISQRLGGSWQCWLLVFVLVLGNHLLSCQTQLGFSFILLLGFYIICFSFLLKLTLLEEIKSSCHLGRKTSER